VLTPAYFFCFFYSSCILSSASFSLLLSVYRFFWSRVALMLFFFTCTIKSPISLSTCYSLFCSPSTLISSLLLQHSSNSLSPLNTSSPSLFLSYLSIKQHFSNSVLKRLSELFKMSDSLPTNCFPFMALAS